MSSTDQSRLLGHPPPEDTFNDAVDQLQAGLPLADILESVPMNSRDELSELLNIVEFTQQVQTSAIPMPSRAKRSRSKANFLAAAQAMSAQSEAAAPIPQSRRDPARPKVVAQQNGPILEPASSKPIYSSPARSGVAPSRSRLSRPTPRPVQPEPSLFQQFSEAIGNLFAIRTVRFAPLVVLLGLILVGGSSIFSVQASIPGDLTYPIKQWVRNRQIDIASDSERNEMLKQHQIVVAKDVRQAVTKAHERDIDIEAEEILLYYGMEGRRHLIGDLLVSPRYQSDNAEDNEFTSMDIVGELSQVPPGTEVRLAYQVVPGQVADDGRPIVQGVTLQVIATPDAVAQVVVPTPLPTITDIPRSNNELVAGVTPSRLADIQPIPTLLTTPDSLGTLPTITPTPQIIATATPTLAIITPTPEPKLVGVTYCEISTLTGWETHIVQQGDTLWKLATRGGKTVEILKEVNCLKSDQIIAGDELNIPPQLLPTSTAIPTNAPQVIPLTETPTPIPPTLTYTSQPLPTLIPPTLTLIDIPIVDSPTATSPAIIYPTAIPPTQAPQSTLASSTEIPSLTQFPTPTLSVGTSSTGEINNENTINYDATAVPLITSTNTPPVPSDVTTISATVSTSVTVTVVSTVEATAISTVTATVTTITATGAPVIITTQLPTKIATGAATLLPTIVSAPTATRLPDDALPVPTSTSDVISLYTFTPTPISVQTVTASDTPESEVPPTEVTPTVTSEVNASTNQTNSGVLEPTVTVDVATVPSVTVPLSTATSIPTENIPVITTAQPTPTLVSAPVEPTEISLSENTPELPTPEISTPTPVVITISTENSNESNTEESTVEPTDLPTATPEVISAAVPTVGLPTEVSTPEPPTPTIAIIINTNENNTEESYVEPTPEDVLTPVPTDAPSAEVPASEPPTPTLAVIINPNENSTEESYAEPTPEDILTPVPTDTDILSAEVPASAPPTPTVVVIINPNENSTEESYAEPTDPSTATPEVISAVPTDAPSAEVPASEPPTPTLAAIINPNENNTEEVYVEPTDIPTATPIEVPLIENTPELPTPTPVVVSNPTESNIEAVYVEPTEIPTATPIPVEPTATLAVVHMFSTPTAEATVAPVIEKPVTTGSERVSPLAPPSSD